MPSTGNGAAALSDADPLVLQHGSRLSAGRTRPDRVSFVPDAIFAERWLAEIYDPLDLDVPTERQRRQREALAPPGG